MSTSDLDQLEARLKTPLDYGDIRLTHKEALALLARVKAAEDAHLKICETLGLQATALAHLNVKAVMELAQEIGVAEGLEKAAIKLERDYIGAEARILAAAIRAEISP